MLDYTIEQRCHKVPLEKIGIGNWFEHDGRPCKVLKKCSESFFVKEYMENDIFEHWLTSDFLVIPLKLIKATFRRG
jgi:hypothetical protein